MATKSEELVWNIVKKNNAYLLKTRRYGGLELSTEKFNVANRNTFRFSGFRDRAVDVRLTKKGFVRVEKKNNKYPNRPKKAAYGDTIKKHGFSARAESIALQTKGMHYRPEVAAAAVERYRKLHNVSQKNKSAVTTGVKSGEVIKSA
jgi:large subunit ribosomal protein L28e